MWHAVGARICGLLTYVALPCSRGTVMLADPDPQSSPVIDFNGLSDDRDRQRLVHGARFSAKILLEELGPRVIADVFPARLSRRIEMLSRPNRMNAALATLGAALMDASPRARSLIIRHVITHGETLADILADDRAADEFVERFVGTSWHPCGTCRMGSPHDGGAVTDPRGAVIGTTNLFVGDASLMPRITRTNTNLPTIMIAERMSEFIQI
ncbi:MAG: GMC family oxidoreductase [Burkholderiales bacterium]|nr:GMC family oxidoreductase [Burkholderiales bacterium]